MNHSHDEPPKIPPLNRTPSDRSATLTDLVVDRSLTEFEDELWGGREPDPADYLRHVPEHAREVVQQEMLILREEWIAQRDELANQFRSLWRTSNSPPDVVAFLSEHPRANIHQQLAVLLRVQRDRWRTEQPMLVEDYLARLPHLQEESHIQLELAVWEFRCRTRTEAPPEIADFTSRFPEIAETLRSRLTSWLEQAARSDPLTGTYISQQTVGSQQAGRYRLGRLLREREPMGVCTWASIKSCTVRWPSKCPRLSDSRTRRMWRPIWPKHAGSLS